MKKFETKNSKSDFVCTTAKSDKGPSRLICKAVAPVEAEPRFYGQAMATTTITSTTTEIVYDYIVVGAGTAGAALARKLSDPDVNGKFTKSVLVLEAGKNLTDDPEIQIPTFLKPGLNHDKLYFEPKYSKTLIGFSYNLDPESAHSTYVASDGRMWGGSSAHNGLQAYRPTPTCFNKWAAITGNNRWTYANLLANVIKSMEHFSADFVINSSQRGTTGPQFITVEPRIDNTTVDPHGIYPALANFVNAPLKLDTNDMSTGEVGIGPNQNWMTPQAGAQPWNPNTALRSNSANAYLTGVPSQGVAAAVSADGKGLGKRLLTILSNAYAEKVLFVDKVATYVTYQQVINNQSQSFQARARSKIILSAGAFYDPAILQRSGVGDASILTPLGIPVVVNNPNVGRHLKNHVGIYTGFGDFAGGTTSTNVDPQAYVNGFIDVLATYGGGNTGTGSERRFQILTFTNGEFGSGAPMQMIGGYYVTPKTEGQVIIQTADPHSDPFVAFNFYGDGPTSPPFAPDSDMAMAVAYLKQLKDFVDTHYPGTWVGAPYFVDASTFEDDTAWPFHTADQKLADYVYNNAQTKFSQTYHNSSTARMAASIADGVVDGNLQVFGVKNLMVASTSVFPEITPCNTSYGAYVVGLEAARIIKAGL